MNLSIRKLPKSKVELKFYLDSEDLKSFKQQAILDLGKDTEIKGFRKGTAPLEILEKEISPEKITEATIDLSIKKTYIKALTENNIEAIGSPEVKIVKFTPWSVLEFYIEVQIMPEINLPDYKKLASQIVWQKIQLDEKEVEDALNWLRKSRAKFFQVTRPCQKGDFVEIEFSNSIDNRNYKDAFVLGEGKFVPGFEENIEGMSAGQQKNFSVTLPQDYPRSELAGKTVNFTIKLNSVQKMELPEFNDDFARSLGNFDSLDDLKQSVKEGLWEEKKIAEVQRVRNEIVNKISANTKCEIPEALLKAELEREINVFQKEVLEKLQMSFDDYLSKLGKTRQELEKDIEPQAILRIKNQLILRAIAKAENITVKEEEIEEEANKFLRRYPSVKEAQKDIDPNQLRLYIEDVIRTEKVLEKLEGYVRENPNSKL